MKTERHSSGKNDSGKQLRGEQLASRIEFVIRELAAEAKSKGKEYVYNSSEVARRVPTTRKTLGRHDEVVSRVLDELRSRRRLVTGTVGLEHLRDEVSRLKDEIATRDRAILALRTHHVELYTRLHAHSVTGAHLIHPILDTESDEAGSCILCGADISERRVRRAGGNVVDLPTRGQKDG